MNWLERFFRRRAMQREDLAEAELPAALQPMHPGQTFAAHGYNWRVQHRRVQPNGRHPAIVCTPIGPTRKVLKHRRTLLRRLLRRERG